MPAHPLDTALDPLDPRVRAAALRLVSQVDDDSQVGEVVRAMLTDLSRGERVVVLRVEDEVTPAQAATMLGVTRQYVDRLFETGVLAFRRLPGSRHRRIRVRDVIQTGAERDTRRAGHDDLRTAIDEAGLLDEA